MCWYWGHSLNFNIKIRLQNYSHKFGNMTIKTVKNQTRMAKIFKNTFVLKNTWKQNTTPRCFKAFPPSPMLLNWKNRSSFSHADHNSNLPDMKEAVALAVWKSILWWLLGLWLGFIKRVATPTTPKGNIPTSATSIKHLTAYCSLIKDWEMGSANLALHIWELLYHCSSKFQAHKQAIVVVVNSVPRYQNIESKQNTMKKNT